MVGSISGKPFAAAMDETVFAPFGMSRTVVKDDVEALIPDNAASYYQDSEGRWRHTVLTFGVHGATNVHSTLDDMLRWGIGLAARGADGRSWMARMGAPGRLVGGGANAYGTGFIGARLAGRPTIEHGGADASFRHFLIYLPDADLGVVVLANREIDAHRLATQVARAWLDLPDEAVEDAASAAPVSADFAGVFAGGITDNAIAITVQGGAASVRASPGAFDLVNDGEIPATADGPNRLKLAGLAVTLTLTRNPRGKVTGLVERNDINPVAPYQLSRRLLPPPVTTPSALAAFTGVYRSAALDKSYRLTSAGGSLQIEDLAAPTPVALTATGPDRFELWDYAWRTLRFERRGGRVVALRVDADRATGICFDRLNAAGTPSGACESAGRASAAAVNAAPARAAAATVTGVQKP